MPSLSNFPSSQVRKTFLDYFGHRSAFSAQTLASQVIAQHEHKIVPSISLLPPLNDSSLTFVNAGMNAWKHHFLGASGTTLPSLKIANAQKCVRVNDVDLVGIDSYHHTFFEMLGSWSFNQSYTKEDACRMAWEFLTGPMELEKEKLYVTYFNGSGEHNSDDQTREIWRSIGIKESHIIGFGADDNFWEMGITGPCGPCTEIHYDHNNRGAAGVNKGHSDLIELWNIVFIEKQRNLDGTFSSLSSQHIDTGMGLERLCAIKNRTTSNFNTDLFSPIFEELARSTGAPEYKDKYLTAQADSRKLIASSNNCLNTAYRVIGDHTRMISACLSDGFFPDRNHWLKDVIKRTLRSIETNFVPDCDKSKRAEVLSNLCTVNSNILGESYPELYENLDKVKLAIEYENEILIKREEIGRKAFLPLKEKCPQLAELIDPIDASQFQDALKLLEGNMTDTKTISGDMAYKLYDSAGLRENDIEMIAKCKNLSFDQNEFQKSFDIARSKSKLMSAISSSSGNMEKLQNITPTEDHYKYIFQRKTDTHYAFPMIKAKILSILDADDQSENKCSEISDETESSIPKKLKGDKCGIILDKTTFYHEAGGQVGDRGVLIGPNGATFTVHDCQKLEGTDLVLHLGTVTKGFFKLGLDVQVHIDTNHRIGCMQNHSATHLLNYILHSTLPMTYQHSSRVDSDELKFEFSAYNVDFNIDMITDIELKVNNLIGKKSDIVRNTIKAEDSANYMKSISSSFNDNSLYEESNQNSYIHVETDQSNESIQNHDANKNHLDSYESEIFPLGLNPKFISIPGEIYPDEINVINVCGGVEPCCGTHVQNTGDIQSFVIVNCKSAGKGSIKSMKCVTGHRALEARNNGLNLLADVAEIAEELELIDEKSSPNMLTDEECSEKLNTRSPYEILKNIKAIKKAMTADNTVLPHLVRIEVEYVLEELLRHLKKSDKATTKEKMINELEEVLEDSTHLGYIVHFFTNEPAHVKLNSFDKMCKDKPSLLLMLDNKNCLSARARVPKNYLQTCDSGASSWLLQSSEVLNNNPSVMKNIKKIKVSTPSGKTDKEMATWKVQLASNDKETNVKTIANIVDSARKFATESLS